MKLETYGRRQLPVACTVFEACCGLPSFPQVNGLHVKTLGGDRCCGPAQTLMGYMEQGVFKALADGFLENAVLIMSLDEAATEVIEAWNLAVHTHMLLRHPDVGRRQTSRLAKPRSHLSRYGGRGTPTASSNLASASTARTLSFILVQSTRRTTCGRRHSS